MPANAHFFLAIGAILALGMLVDTVGQRTPLPRVSLLVLLGILVGPAAFDVLPDVLLTGFDIVSVMALVIIGFLLGGKLNRETLAESGKPALTVSLLAALLTVAIVLAALLAVGLPPELAVLLACIAAATDATATVDTVTESGRDNAFTRLLLLVVALDDIWGLIIFSLGLAAFSIVNGLQDSSPLHLVATDIGGGVLIGLLLGLPAAYLTGRIKPGEPMMMEALALTLLCGGLAIWAGASFLIAAMVMGAAVGNLASHHEHPFHEIENIQRPFLVVFFVLAGASLQFDALLTSGVIALVYIGSRVLGKTVGAAVGTAATGRPPATGRWLGVAMLPQAGVAVGMALVAVNSFPGIADELLPVVIGATVVFEIIGPLGTRLSIGRCNDKN